MIRLNLTIRHTLSAIAVLTSLLVAPSASAGSATAASSTTAWWTRSIPSDVVATIRTSAQATPQDLQYRRQRAALIANSGSSELPSEQYADVHASWEAPFLPSSPSGQHPPEFVSEQLLQQRNIQTASFASDVIESYLRLATSQELLTRLVSNEVQLQQVLANLQALKNQDTSGGADSLIDRTERILGSVQNSKRLLTAEKSIAQETLTVLLGQPLGIAGSARDLPTLSQIPATDRLAATRPDILLGQAHLRELTATAGCAQDAFDLEDQAGALQLKHGTRCLPPSHPIGGQIVEFSRYVGIVGKEVETARTEYFRAYGLLSSHVAQLTQMAEAVARGDYVPSDADLQLYRAEVTYGLTLRARLAAARLAKISYGNQ